MDELAALELGVWEPHPFVSGLERKVLLTHQRDGAPCTVYLFRAQDAVELPQESHSHAQSEDIALILRGTAQFWQADRGSWEISAGSLTRVPAGIAHRIVSVSSDFLSLNWFVPPIE